MVAAIVLARRRDPLPRQRINPGPPTMTVMIAVPVHEREALLRHCLTCLRDMRRPPDSAIVLFDDASPTLRLAPLLAALGVEWDIRRADRRHGADGSVWRILNAFVDSPHDHLLFLDSDMVANPDALEIGMALRQRFTGLLSLYNSMLHTGVAEGPDLIRKRSVGNAGTLWTRALAERVIAGLGTSPSYIDWRYCDLLRAEGVPIASTARSLLQHIGIGGTNNERFGELEHGLGYTPQTENEARALAFAYDALLSRQADFVPPRPNSVLGRWFFAFGRRLG